MVARTAIIRCRQCGQPVEVARECYAVPACYDCLPPPDPLPVLIPPMWREARYAGGPVTHHPYQAWMFGARWPERPAAQRRYIMLVGAKLVQTRRQHA